ncbi:MAG: hypothetical protein R3349_04970 [Geminicoccaceae bacterium]|nr:hypothetical protein [Geminicoccaceae bacterium]
MPFRPLPAFLVLMAVQLTFVFPAPSDEALDLRVAPEDVEPDQPASRLDLQTSVPKWTEAGPGEPGWSVRPEVEVEMQGSTEDGSGLRALDPDLESLGLRLKRTW